MDPAGVRSSLHVREVHLGVVVASMDGVVRRASIVRVAMRRLEHVEIGLEGYAN